MHLSHLCLSILLEWMISICRDAIYNLNDHFPFPAKTTFTLCNIMERSKRIEGFATYARSYFILNTISSMFSAYPNFTIPRQVSPGLTFKRFKYSGYAFMI